MVPTSIPLKAQGALSEMHLIARCIKRWWHGDALAWLAQSIAPCSMPLEAHVRGDVTCLVQCPEKIDDVYLTP